jgi:hypothetical protein
MGSKDSRSKAQASRKLSFWTFCTANGEIHHLAKHVRRGILDWQREITALAESGPPMDEASVGLIEQGLQEAATTRFFVKAARAQEWIEWIEKRGVFEALFDTPTLSERSNLLARWLAEHYALQYPSKIFLLIGRHNLRLNSTFWWALARQVSLGESPHRCLRSLGELAFSDCTAEY